MSWRVFSLGGKNKTLFKIQDKSFNYTEKKRDSWFDSLNIF